MCISMYYSWAKYYLFLNYVLLASHDIIFCYILACLLNILFVRLPNIMTCISSPFLLLYALKSYDYSIYWWTFRLLPVFSHQHTIMHIFVHVFNFLREKPTTILCSFREDISFLSVQNLHRSHPKPLANFWALWGPPAGLYPMHKLLSFYV